jgi:hypothetical protein
MGEHDWAQRVPLRDPQCGDAARLVLEVRVQQRDEPTALDVGDQA